MKTKYFAPFVIFGLASPIVLSSCSNSSNSNIVFANWESYMSDNLIKRITRENGVQFLNYATNEEIETKFKDYYDVAVPSSYEMFTLIQKGWIEKIDWTKFNLYQLDKDNEKTNKLITNGTEALTLFTDNIQSIIKQQTIAYKDICHFADNENILDYGIPYFLQNLIFAYKGASISQIDNAQNWSEMLKTISPIYNKDLDHRFKPSNTNHIAMVDDSRTVYDLCKLVSNQEKYPDDQDKWNVNPNNDGETIKNYKNDYSAFTSKFKNGYFYLNSDSGQIYSSFANLNGNKSVFSYNGDILYAATGGGLYDFYYDEDNPVAPSYTEHNVNIFNPACSPLVLEFVVMNKKNYKNENKRNKVYDVVKKVVLENADDKNAMIDVDDSDNYISGPLVNFDEVNYTDPLRVIDDYVINGDYFPIANPETKEEGYTQEQVNLFKKIYSIPDFSSYKIDNLFEKPISDLDKSNMHWAYAAQKEKL